MNFAPACARCDHIHAEMAVFEWPGVSCRFFPSLHSIRSWRFVLHATVNFAKPTNNNRNRRVRGTCQPICCCVGCKIPEARQFPYHPESIMKLSFNPDQLDLPIGHHIVGAFQSAKGELTMRRRSDHAALKNCPIADADTVNRAIEVAQTA